MTPAFLEMGSDFLGAVLIARDFSTGFGEGRTGDLTRFIVGTEGIGTGVGTEREFGLAAGLIADS